jgi:hypothetical protein
METEFKNTIDYIFNYSCPYLNLDDRVGHTGYIDFINPDELEDMNIMKGIDYYSRKFIVFKSEIIINNDKIKTFTIFFQRYKESMCCFHTAGDYTKLLFVTVGGCNLEQMKYLVKLLKNGSIELDYNQACDFRMNYSYLYNYNEEEKNNFKCKIQLGWS